MRSLDVEGIAKWSPNGEWIAAIHTYLQDRFPRFQLLVMKPDGSERRVLVDQDQRFIHSITWWGGGDRIIYVLQRAFLSGTEEVKGFLVPSGEPVGGPAYFTLNPRPAPFGKGVAYSCGGDICVSGHNLTNSPDVRESSPSWSPDGSLLAYESGNDGTRDIFTIDVATREISRITEHSSDDYSPTWSPDGDQIAYLSDRSGGDRVRIHVLSGVGDQDEWIPDRSRVVGWAAVKKSGGGSPATEGQLQR